MRSADAEVDGSFGNRATARREEDASPDIPAQNSREAFGHISSRHQSRSSAWSRLGEQGRRGVARHRESSSLNDSFRRGPHHDRAPQAVRKTSHRPEAAPGVDPNDRWQSDQ